jgi:hypothetical protein
MTDRISIPQAISRLLDVVALLQAAHPSKRFTLDGRLLGDIGEILAAAAYEVTLLEGLAKHHDATTNDGRRVQIKATMQRHLTFPCDHSPDYYLGIVIHRDGSFSEVFNGPGAVLQKALAHRKGTKTNLHAISISTLLRLQQSVEEGARIPLRPAALIRPIPLRSTPL